MDLNRLYRYRRGELEREARRLGVERPERLDRRELERRIRDASGGSTTKRARRAFRKVLGFAKALASFDVEARKGVLEDDGDDLRRLLGRPTTPLASRKRWVALTRLLSDSIGCLNFSQRSRSARTASKSTR